MICIVLYCLQHVSGILALCWFLINKKLHHLPDYFAIICNPSNKQGRMPFGVMNNILILQVPPPCIMYPRYKLRPCKRVNIQSNVIMWKKTWPKSYIYMNIVMSYCIYNIVQYCIILLCCSNVVHQHQAVAGMMAAFFIVLGLFCGVVFSTPAILAIQHWGTGHVDDSNVTHH